MGAQFMTQIVLRFLEFQKAKDDLSHELRTHGSASRWVDNSRSGSDIPSPIGTGIDIAQTKELRGD